MMDGDDFASAWDDESIEHAIMGDGVNFNVKYIGCIEILTSMKKIDFQSRQVISSSVSSLLLHSYVNS
jgi:hypothetical protein